ncbi:DUF3320 domain-containing protein [Phyllobacterium sp. LjRoot231]
MRKTKELATRTLRNDISVVSKLKDAQQGLNLHADAMHSVHEPSGITPYQLIGQLVRVADGFGIPDYSLAEPAIWTPADFQARTAVCEELTDRFSTIGNPVDHPWYGTRREALDPSELENLRRSLGQIKVDLEASVDLGRDASARLEFNEAKIFSDLARLLLLLRAISSIPEGDRIGLADAVWQRPERISHILEIGQKLRALRTKVDESFSETVWSSSLNECRTAVAAKGRSIFRVFNGQYRSQLALLKSYLKIPLPKDQAARLALIDTVLLAQDARRELDDQKTLGASAFGSEWADEKSNWEKLRTFFDWYTAHDAVLTAENRARIARALDLPRLGEIETELSKILGGFVRGWNELQTFLDLDMRRTFGVENLQTVHLEQLLSKLHLWSENIEGVTKWASFYDRCRFASQLGLSSLVDGILDGRLDAETLVPTFEKSYYEALRTDFFSREPELKRFDGELHSRLVDTFRNLERARVSLARDQIATRHTLEMPRSNGGIGPLGVLNGELAKKRNHLPIRQLLDRAGAAIQQIKPIFMMSPLSVAQFLKPGSMSFDLLVVDEASQIEPVDALGAVARCKQIVVVGDERQLPPTRFFAKLTSDTEERDEDDEITFHAGDAESILDLCLAKGMSFRMLNWHYRSRHQSLIAVSNREFYENRLFIVPSPYDAIAGMGLKLNYLPHAQYDRGNTRTNPIEARSVAEAVIGHALEKPEQSLGVATFSVAQRQAILKELELLRRQHPETEDFFNRSSTEPFFVKNIENIQGDERDVIFISVGYGKTNTGYIAMNFGPLNSEGGERRLNVLISRAKLRCEVFSSITGDDIDLERVRSRGVAAFKLFLTFAQTGKFGIAEESGNEPDSVFEEQVAEKLRALGHDVKNQIGSAGFYVDLAVSDPEKPGRFVLGIECDGAQYHSSRSARDRDRLRQSVLESHGWILHRVWSTDWYLRPNEELAKLTAAIEAAKSEWRNRDDDLKKPKQAVPLHFSTHTEADVDVVTAHVRAESRAIAVPYDEASLAVRLDREPHEVPLAEMMRYVTQVVSVEGPVHESEIIVRVRSAWGLARSGNRIRDAVTAAIRAAKSQGLIVEANGFFAILDQAVRVRNRSAVVSPSLRKLETLPPSEIETAAIAVVEENFGASRDQLITAISRLLGFASTSTQLRSIIEPCINAAVAAGTISEDNGMLSRSKLSAMSPVE